MQKTKTIAVIRAGTMGSGIAHVLLASKQHTLKNKQDEE